MNNSKKQLAEAKVKSDKYDELVDLYIKELTKIVANSLFK